MLRTLCVNSHILEINQNNIAIGDKVIKTITIGKLRGLQQCTSTQGTFTCLALDHRQNLRKANPAFVNDPALSSFKMDVTSALSSEATAVLLDPEVSAAQAIASGAIPRNTGLIVALEATGYSGDHKSRESRVIQGWSAEQVKRMGASMAKLLVYFHPQSPTAGSVEKFTTIIIKECINNDLALMVEPLSYSLTDEPLAGDEKRKVIVTIARRFSRIEGVDVLKIEMPLDTTNSDHSQLSDTCEEVNSEMNTPWIILSGAAPFKAYEQQVIAACKSGASGIAVGRAVWQESILMKEGSRRDFLNTVAKQRLNTLASLCNTFGRSIDEHFSADAPFDWFRDY